MKHLFLIRHAKSSWDHAELSDFDRPLNKRGKRDAPMMGRRLAKRGVNPDLILSSPAKRALKTARIIGSEIGSPKGDIHTDKRIYEAAPISPIITTASVASSASKSTSASMKRVPMIGSPPMPTAVLWPKPSRVS